MLSSDKIFARFPSMNKLIVMLLTHCESNNRKVKHLYRWRCRIQLMMKLVFPHQFCAQQTIWFQRPSFP
jgi:hypothetical protein